MAFTQQQYDKLEAAIAQGATLVKYDDKEVRYRSLDEMMRILKIMGTQLGIIKPVSNKVVASYHNGIRPNCSDNEKWIR
jgi:hypothetical protein